VWSLAFAPDGKRLAMAGGGGSVKVWDLTPACDRRTIHVPAEGGKSAVDWLAFAADGQTLLTHTYQGTLGRWDVFSGQGVTLPPRARRSSVRPASAPCGSVVTVDGALNQVYVWGPAGAEVQALRYPGPPISAVAVSADGRRVAFADEADSPAVNLWDVGSPQARELARLSGPCYRLAFAPDGRAVAAAESSRVVLLDATQGRLLASLDGHREDVLDLAFSPDGRLLATAGRDRTVRVWDCVTGRERNCLCKHSDAVEAVLFAPDGKTLASVGGEVILWSVAHGQDLITLDGNAGLPPLALAFSPDGKVLAGGGFSADGKSGEVVLWYGAPPGLPSGRAGEAASGR
jgi:WD40 repeat protein